MLMILFGDYTGFQNRRPGDAKAEMIFRWIESDDYELSLDVFVAGLVGDDADDEDHIRCFPRVYIHFRSMNTAQRLSAISRQTACRHLWSSCALHRIWSHSPTNLTSARLWRTSIASKCFSFY